MEEFFKIIIIILGLIFIIHIPRLYIDNINHLNECIHHGEDEYQKQIQKKNNKSRIIAWTVYNVTNDTWKEFITKFKVEALKLIREELKIMDEISNDEILVSVKKKIIKSYNITTNNAICIWINNETKTIRATFDHAFCGGYFFIKYSEIVFQGNRPKLPSIPVYTPFIVETEMLKLVYNKSYKEIYKKYKLVNNPEDITRITYKLNKKNKPNNASTKTWILWSLIISIMNTDKNRKGLDIMIPIAFNKLANIYNNIGVIFIKYNRGDSLESLTNQINNNKCQALATNYYLRFSKNKGNQGCKIRNNVDIVFTSSYNTNCSIDTTCITTYNNIADYAIYCFSSTMNNNITITVTINTNELESKELLNHLPNSKYID